MNEPGSANEFIVTKEHRCFVEFCDACRRFRYIGVCYGSPGVGKTLSARKYSQWDEIEHLDSLFFEGIPTVPEMMDCRTVFYTASVASSARRIEQAVAAQRNRLSSLLNVMQQVLDGAGERIRSHRLDDLTELILIDEADRLNAQGLEQLRDIYDRSQLGLVLIGMPGLDKRLSRYPQLYSRVGFVHHFRSLSSEELQFILEHKWQELGLTLDPADFTDSEAMAAIIRITAGNFRLLQRLFSQIERILEINQLQIITQEVVETAREGLVIGLT